MALTPPLLRVHCIPRAPQLPRSEHSLPQHSSASYGPVLAGLAATSRVLRPSARGHRVALAGKKTLSSEILRRRGERFIERQDYLRSLGQEEPEEEGGKHGREATVEVEERKLERRKAREGELEQRNEEVDAATKAAREEKAAMLEAHTRRAEARAARIAELCSTRPLIAREDFMQHYEETGRAQKVADHGKQADHAREQERELEVTQPSEEIGRVEEAAGREKQVERAEDEEAAGTALASRAEAHAAHAAVEEVQEQELVERNKETAEAAEREGELWRAGEGAAQAQAAVEEVREQEPVRRDEAAEREAEIWRKRDAARTAKVVAAAKRVAELQGKGLPSASEARRMTLVQLRDTMWKAGLPVCGLPSAQQAKELEPSELKERLLQAKTNLLTQLLWVLSDGEEDQDEGEKREQEQEEQEEENTAEFEQQGEMMPGGKFF